MCKLSETDGQKDLFRLVFLPKSSKQFNIELV